jgi:hypothetical protein
MKTSEYYFSTQLGVFVSRVKAGDREMYSYHRTKKTAMDDMLKMRALLSVK